MSRAVSLDVIDILNDIDDRIGFLVAVTAVDAVDIFTHSQGIRGLCAVLDSIERDLEKALIALGERKNDG